MRKLTRRSGPPSCRALSAAATVAFFAMSLCTPAGAVDDRPVSPPNSQSVQVSLIQQDSSDCSNSTVKDDPNRTKGGVIALHRNSDGTTSVSVSMTVSPNTNYHFYLKCVRALGDIKTDDYGYGSGTFTFQTSSVGNTYGFDMYPDGAPAGNKFQSTQVAFH